MPAGFLALLDDVAAIAKMAASSLDDVTAASGKATAKATGVVVDDTAVTPQYVQGITANRELPIVRQIAVGSLRNKLLIILPIALILAQWAPWLITPILMIGGAYLSFEGFEKVIEHVFHRGHDHESPTPDMGHDEKKLVAGAVRTDLILSTEIMVIALNEVADQSFWMRFGALVVVAIVITIGVYGVVGVIVKMDDVGLALAQRPSAFAQRFGNGLVTAMPRLLAVVTVVGIIAMLWVGGHLVISGLHDVNGLAAGSPGWGWPYSTVEHAKESIAEAIPGVGGAVGWIFETFCSAVVGLVVGGIVAGGVGVVGRVLKR